MPKQDKPEAATFWMVWREYSRDTAYRHNTREGADDEAKRLARQCPGEMFYVLKCAAGFVCPVAPVTSAKIGPPQPDPDVPF